MDHHTKFYSNNTNRRNDISMRHRLGMAALACVQIGLFGGILYGWPTIDRTMLVAPFDQGGAGLTPDETTFIYSWACSVTMCATLFLGLVLDIVGPRACSMVGHASIAAGGIIFAMGSSMNTFAIATTLIAFGGPAFHLSIAHLANLFPEQKFFALSFMFGIDCLSFLVFAVFDYLWESYQPLSFRPFFGALAVFAIISMLASLQIWPDKPFHDESEVVSHPEDHEQVEHFKTILESNLLLEPPSRTYSDVTSLSDESLASLDPPEAIEAKQVMFGLVCEEDEKQQEHIPLHGSLKWKRHMSIRISRYALATGNYEYVSLKDRPLLQQLGSGTYIRTLVVFATCCFFANLFIASISTELADLQDFAHQKQHSLVQIMTLIMAASFGVAIVAGWLIDQLGVDCAAILTLLIGQLYLLFIWLRHDNWIGMVASFVCYAAFRHFYYSVFYAALPSKLGFKYFGLLSSIGFAVTGIMQFMMSPVVSAVQGDCHLQVANMWTENESETTTPASENISCNEGKWMALHEFEILVLAMLMLAPIVDYYQSHRWEKQAHDWWSNVQQQDRTQRTKIASQASAHSSITPATSSTHSLYGSV